MVWNGERPEAVKLLTLDQLRFFRFTPWSTLTVLLGVTLAVSSIVAVHQISQRVVASLAAVTPAHLAGVTHLLTRPGLAMSDYFELRAQWRAGDLGDLKGMMPLVEGAASGEIGALSGEKRALSGEKRVASDEFSETSGQSYRIIGVDAFSGITSAGRLALLVPGTVISGPGGAEGQKIRFSGRDHEVVLTVPTLADDLLITDIGTAQRALGRSDTALDAIAVEVVSPGQTLLEWSDRLMPGFSSGISLETFALPGWEVRTVAQSLPSLEFARSVLFNLGALGSLALVVAWLLVYQVGVIWLRRRATTLERLMQMGVSEWELKRTFLASLTCLGLLASVLGLLVGQQLAELLTGAATGYGDALPSVPLDRWLVAKASGSALVVCGVGGWVAYRRESGHNARFALWPAVLFSVVCMGAYGLYGSDSLLGGFLGIAAVGLLVLVGISPLLKLLRSLSRRLRGRLLTRIGLRELLWYPGDLSIAIGALVLALATSVAMALMVDSFREDFEAMLEQRMVHDLFVSGTGEDLSALAASLESLPGIRVIKRYGSTERRVGNLLVAVGYTRFDAQESRRYGLTAPLAPGECLVSERLARSLDLGTGDALARSDGSLRVAGIFSGFGDTLPRLLLNTSDALALGMPARFDRLSIGADDTAAVQAALRRWDPALEVQAQGAMRARALSIFDQTFAITGALTFLALMVASVGLYNALLALELLQQPSRKLLVAMGVTLGERRMIAGWRVVGIGLTTVALALPLGVIMGWLLCTVINPRAFGWSLQLSFTPASFLWPVLSALGVMTLVSLAPVPSEAGTEAGDEATL